MRLCCCRTSPVQGAGVVFTDGKHILAGYQPYKAKPCISGIGGSSEPGENYLTTAIREMLEELFEPSNDSAKLQNLNLQIQAKYIPKRIIQSGDYTMIIYNFNDLESILEFIHENGLITPLYTVFPLSLIDLIRERKVEIGVEISHFALLPLIRQVSIDSNLISDIQLLCTPT